MSQPSTSNNDGFFDYLAENKSVNGGNGLRVPGRQIQSPSEVVFQDADGTMKVLRGGEVVALEEADDTAGEQSVKSVAEAKEREQRTVDIEAQARAVALQAQLSPTETDRLQKILESRLRGVRNNIQVRSVLMEAKEQHGLGLSETATDQIIYQLNHVLERISSPASSVVSSNVQAQTEIAPRSEDSMHVATPIIQEAPLQTTLVGPIEELRKLTLTDFRSLGNTPQQSAAAIWQKIKLLGMESFGQLIAGITAWRKSEIFRQYIAIGHDSMMNNQSIKESIAVRAASTDATLTVEEFTAIGEFNQKLTRYQ